MREDIWDLEGGRGLERVHQGESYWGAADGELYLKEGPIRLRVLVPGGREIVGEFVMVRVLHDGQRVEHVSMAAAPGRREQAFKQVRSLLASAGGSEGQKSSLKRWYAEEEANSRQGILLMDLGEMAPPLVSVEILKTWSPVSDGGWVVNVVFSWRLSLPGSRR